MPSRVLAALAIAALLISLGAAPVAGQELPAGVEVETIVAGLDSPWALAFTPDGRVFFTESNTGNVRELVDGTIRTVHTLALDPTGEGGLLGLAVSPNWAQDGLLYAYYTTSSDNRIVRFRPGGTVDPVLTGIPGTRIHHGGRIKFGPDEMLYAGTGDAGSPELAQDLGSLAGKILRVTPSGAVPAGNPIAGSPVWTLGHRNVQGLAWDAAGRMFATEFGPDRDDEINHIVARRNYGWPHVTGMAGDDRYTDPVFVRQPPEASWSGATVLTSGAIPGWQGDLFAAALRGQRLWRLDLDGTTVVAAEALLTGQFGRIRDAVEAPDGSLWLLTGNNDGNDRIVRISGTRPQDPTIAAACPDDDIPAAGFRDVSARAVHAQAIDCLAHFDIADGRTTSRFEPERAVTRGQMASFVARLLSAAGFDLPAPGDQGWRDVPSDHTHRDAINQLAEVGIVHGTTATTFEPDVRLDRAQAASFVVRAYEELAGEALPPGDDAFGDDTGVHEDAINAAAAAGLVRGTGAGRYDPGATIPRDQMASLVARTLDLAVRELGVQPGA